MISFICRLPGRGKFAVRYPPSAHSLSHPDNFYSAFEEQGSHEKLKVTLFWPICSFQSTSGSSVWHFWDTQRTKTRNLWIQINTPVPHPRWAAPCSVSPCYLWWWFHDELGAQTLRAGIQELLSRSQHTKVSQDCKVITIVERHLMTTR